MRTVVYIAAGYLAIVAVAAIVSNTSQDSPTADTVASLPSAGSFLGAGSIKANAGINLVAAGVLAVLPRFGVV